MMTRKSRLGKYYKIELSLLGITELIFITITIILGLSIIAKYPKTKNRELETSYKKRMVC